MHVTLDSDIYRSSQNVRGKIAVSGFKHLLTNDTTVVPSYDFTADFKSSKVDVRDQEISKSGESFFSFNIPARIAVQNTQIVFKVKIGDH